MLMAEGAGGRHRTAALLKVKGQAPPLGFAIHRDSRSRCLPARGYGNRERGKVRPEHRRESLPIEFIEFAEQALQHRLARGPSLGEAQQAQHLGRLARSPLGSRQHRAVVGQDRRHRQC